VTTDSEVRLGVVKIGLGGPGTPTRSRNGTGASAKQTVRAYCKPLPLKCTDPFDSRSGPAKTIACQWDSKKFNI
jgi:hypothetical protein